MVASRSSTQQPLHRGWGPVQFWTLSHLQRFLGCFQGDACSGGLCHCHCSQQPSPQGCIPREETTSTQKLTAWAPHRLHLWGEGLAGHQTGPPSVPSHLRRQRPAQPMHLTGTLRHWEEGFPVAFCNPSPGVSPRGAKRGVPLPSPVPASEMRGTSAARRAVPGWQIGRS